MRAMTPSVFEAKLEQLAALQDALQDARKARTRVMVRQVDARLLAFADAYKRFATSHESPSDRDAFERASGALLAALGELLDVVKENN